MSTVVYNGQFPGPLLRFKEGQRTWVDIYNDTDNPNSCTGMASRWASTSTAPPRKARPTFPHTACGASLLCPARRGSGSITRTWCRARDLSRGQYSGLVGPVYIEPKQNPGAYDQEIFLTLKEFEPSFTRGGDMAANFLAGDEDPDLKDKGESAMKASLDRGDPHGYEVGYASFAINGRALGHGDPIRVQTGQRVLLHVLNGSATETRSLALPGHIFTVIALDGNPVPNPHVGAGAVAGRGRTDLCGRRYDQPGGMGTGRSFR